MWKDPIVEKVRLVRDSYAKQFNYDLEAIYNDLKSQETKSDREFVSLSPKRIKLMEKAEQLLTPGLNTIPVHTGPKGKATPGGY